MTLVLRRLLKRAALRTFKELADQTPLQVFYCFKDGKPKIEIIEQTAELTKFSIRFPVIIWVKCLTEDFPKAKKEIESMEREETFVIAGAWYLNTLSSDELFQMLKDIEEIAIRAQGTPSYEVA